MASLNIAGVLKPAAKGHGGAHVAHHKNTSAMPVERMPVPASVTIPLSQHIGAPNEAQVKVGDEVKVGQVIGSVGQTALLEYTIGDHLHFSVTVSGEAMDPEDFLTLG